MRWLVTSLLAVAACTDVNGGAVELSWRFRPQSGGGTSFLDCTSGLPGTGAIDRIELDWRSGDVVDSASWKCTDGHGVTGFVVPSGGALFSVKPLCASGPAAEGTYTAPSAELRSVNVGQTVNLGGVEMVLVVSDCGLQPCICQ